MTETRFISIEETRIDEKIIREAGKIIESGGLVAFPTETVYGLGGDALNRESCRKIYAAKGRPSDNPLIVHICKWNDIGKIAAHIPQAAVLLADAFWPGPLTMILEKTEAVPAETTGGLSTVAVRMPRHKTALALIEAAGGYVAAPSANTSGRPSPTLAAHVREDLDGRIDMILDGGAACIGLESTIVDLTEACPVILRPGYITKEMLEQVLHTKVELDRPLADMDAKQAPKAPGMKYRHYAPSGELTVVSGEGQSVVAAIRRLAGEKMEAGERTGIICSAENRQFYRADHIEVIGAKADEEAAARHLYAALRSFDSKKIAYIYAEAVTGQGVGAAVMNRLLKAAGQRMVEADRR